MFQKVLKAASGMRLVNVSTKQTWRFGHAQVLWLIGIHFSLRPKEEGASLGVCLPCVGASTPRISPKPLSILAGQSPCP